MTKAREWKELPLYEGLYEVSSDGLLRSTKRQGSSGGNRSFHTALNPQEHLLKNFLSHREQSLLCKQVKLGDMYNEQ